jgi:hypothetical protein
MKKNLLLTLSAFLLFMTVRSQTGMDYAGTPVFQYSRLRSTFLPQFQNQNNEKALGVYQSNFTPQSFLEINSTPAYMPFPMPGVALGEVFRTTSPNNVNSNWRLFTGTGATAEKFRLTSIANTNDVSLNAVQNGKLFLTTNSFNRFLIDGGAGAGNAGLNGGKIGIGNNLPANFVPQARVHIHQTGGNIFLNNDTYIRFTNNFTTPAANRGFAIGNSSGILGPNGDVQLQQWEQSPLSILLPNAGNTLTNFFHIQNTTGFTGINNPNPIRQLDVNGKVRVQNLNAVGSNAGIVTYNSDGTFQAISFQEDNKELVLMADGSWGLPATNMKTQNEIDFLKKEIAELKEELSALKNSIALNR